MRILVTGAAGFIGFHLAKTLLRAGHQVTGVDNFTPYYDVQLKHDRVAVLAGERGFFFQELDIADSAALHALFKVRGFTHVLNLAAQPGVRYSLVNPQAYVQSNLVGFANVLECCRHHCIQHLVYASSSSVYGLNTTLPFSEQESVDHPVSLYAATKKSNELMAHTYSHLYGLPSTGLRFFTVYGPWGRPDMALFTFAHAILAGRPIDVYNQGKMQRDFTYIDDVVQGVLDVLERPARPDPSWDAGATNPASSPAPWAVYNIGNNRPVALEDFISCMEETLGKLAIRNFLPMQPGDVQATAANIDALQTLTGFTPRTPLSVGMRPTLAWFRAYYQL